MLTQEELDKLLAEENAEAGDQDQKSPGESEQKEEASQEATDSSSSSMSQEELDQLLQEDSSGDGKKQASEEAKGDSPKESAGGDDIDWSDAFQEAAAGGDAAAAKAVSQGLPEDAQAKPSQPQPSQPQESSGAAAAQFGELQGDSVSPGTKPELNFLLEIPLEIAVELGRSTMKIKDLLQLGQGSIVELNKMAGEPADIYVNRKLMAKGEVVVVNEKFGVKLTEIISPQERVKSLG